MPTRPPAAPEASITGIRARLLREIEDIERAFQRTGLRFAMLVLAALMACTVVLIPFALHVAWRALRRDEETRTLLDVLRKARAFGKRAVPVAAYPLMVNRALRSPGEELAPGLFILSFDAGVGDADYMIRLAAALCAGDETGEAGKWTSGQRRFAAALMADEDYRHFRRRKIPEDMTAGRVVYACDLMIQPSLLRGARLSDDPPYLPCLAEPGDAGRLLLVPFWMADRSARATPEQKEAFATSLAYFEAFRKAGENAGQS